MILLGQSPSGLMMAFLPPVGMMSPSMSPGCCFSHGMKLSLLDSAKIFDGGTVEYQPQIKGVIVLIYRPLCWRCRFLVLRKWVEVRLWNCLTKISPLFFINLIHSCELLILARSLRRCNRTGVPVTDPSQRHDTATVNIVTNEQAIFSLNVWAKVSLF